MDDRVNSAPGAQESRNGAELYRSASAGLTFLPRNDAAHAACYQLRGRLAMMDITTNERKGQ